MLDRSPSPLPPFVAAFDACVARAPHAVAVVAPELTWSYEALRRVSCELAEDLARAGCAPGDRVGLALGRSPWHVAAILAVWRLGAAFLPLDPLAPESRWRRCLGEAGARLLLRSGSPVAVEVLAAIEPSATIEHAPARDGEELAYVIYTSGSSGAPKGVRVGHRGLVPMLGAQIDAFGLADGAGKRVLFALSPAFDASVSDLGTALLSGAALVVAPAPLTAPELLPFLHHHAITHADLPPSLLARVDAAHAPVSLETVIIGGEVCPPDVVRAWAKKVRLLNVYGPTEATICTSLVRCDADTWDRPRLGHPLPGVEYRVEDGELLIGGDCLALGYVERPELDAARFVPRDGRRFYRTGDRVRAGSANEDGGLEFLGRFDRQVKVRGQLVSPEEIEMALLRFPEVQEANVTYPASLLTAHVVLRPAAEVDGTSLRERLAAMLPQWMLPRVVIERALARGTTGKLERDPRVATIAAAFAEVLGAAEVTAGSDFFALGGDSLAAVEIAALAQAAGVVFEPSAVLDARTPAAIARTGQNAGRTRAELDAYVTDRLSRAELATAPTVAEAGESERGGDWLVTGATGFLGRRFVAELLRSTERPVHCLVRARDDRHARARLAEHGLDSSRLVAHAGDASAPYLGLSPLAFRALVTDVGREGHVVHLAAAVNQVLSFEALAAANVTAALEIARFVRAAGGEAARTALTHVSSLAVLAASDLAAATIDEDSALAPAARLFGGYAQSKHAAEELLRRAVPSVQLVRPGLLTGDSVTGAPSSTCPLATFLTALVDLRCVPGDLSGAPTVDVTPVDHAARVLARLVQEPSPGRVVHVSSAHGASLSALVAALRAHVDLAAVDADTFVRRVRTRLSRESALAVAAASYRLLGREIARDADLFLLTGRSFAGDRAERLTGLRCPPADARLLDLYVRDAIARVAARGEAS